MSKETIFYPKEHFIANLINECHVRKASIYKIIKNLEKECDYLDKVIEFLEV